MLRLRLTYSVSDRRVVNVLGILFKIQSYDAHSFRSAILYCKAESDASDARGQYLISLLETSH